MGLALVVGERRVARIFRFPDLGEPSLTSPEYPGAPTAIWDIPSGEMRPGLSRVATLTRPFSLTCSRGWSVENRSRTKIAEGCSRPADRHSSTCDVTSAKTE
eukprot:CAMPEP_0174846804 /NCGR_PEP_ID=MMETSP1114-20130205/12522_1 /TAXON_ID=312471 /ORGANISM="Neobodo designis, Strain CCAP 1951/1" /LENGTH=101 /DNA_ID=CAMNT_0016081073 /DNA_START=154 /DNA_END=459 /DNA_ORIENTATION=+